MAAEMKVTEEAVEAACKVFTDTPDDSDNEWFSRDLNEVMRAALEAGLAAMLEPVGWQGEDIENSYTRLHETYKDLAKLEGKPWFRANRVYRIKP